MDVKYKKCRYQELCTCQDEVVDAITKTKELYYLHTDRFREESCIRESTLPPS